MHLYTPIFLSKDGELNALANLDHVSKTKTIPLIQFLKDTNEGRKGNYVKSKVAPLIKGWSFLDNRIYLDVSHLGSDLATIEAIIAQLYEGQVRALPVIYPDTSQPVITLFKSHLYDGVCLRFAGYDIEPRAINHTISTVMQSLSLDASQIDILIDLGYVTENNAATYHIALGSVYDQIKQRENLRKIIVSAGSFPSGLGAFAKDSVTGIPRTEWQLWKHLKQIAPSIIYADYGNSHPVYSYESAKHPGTCSIKYTATDQFYIFKGEKPGNTNLSTGQYQVKSVDLISKPYYSGPGFSWGDNAIMKRAYKEEKPGGSTTWITITQNHHIVKMLSLLER